jgi:malate dehydrogenase (oxaloacetate-decarboxylating)(NADP+)
LAKYRDRICTFNDDIQGTASVALAGILSALRVKGTKLADEKFLFFGAGEAATGIADLIVEALVAEGVDVAQARQRCWLVDSKGLVVKSREGLPAQKRPYAHDHAPVGDFLSTVNALKPTTILGLAAQAGTFTPEVLRAMADANERPIVFALSNPTSKAECTAEQAYQGTDGRALFACGSPFPPVQFAGKTLVPRQGNNSYIFPGIGLGAIACGATRITDEMFLAAARTLAAQVTLADLNQGSLFPPLSKIRDVSAQIAVAVAEVAFERGLAAKSRPEDILSLVQAHVYNPQYGAGGK